MTKQPRRPGPESTLDDVRVQLINAGVRLLSERGVDVGLAHITLSDAIAAAGVTRSTAYRSLADEELAPQAVLHQALLTNLLTRDTRAHTITAIGDAITRELEAQSERLDSDDPATRTVALRAIIRVGAAQSYDDVVKSRERSALMAIYGAVQSSETTDWRRNALVEGERGLTEVFAELYSGLASLFGYTLKQPFTMQQFTAAGASLIEGMAMRDNINPHLEDIERATGPGGQVETWTPFGVAFEALFTGFFQPENPDDPFADLNQY